jgi:hypothetical protein
MRLDPNKYYFLCLRLYMAKNENRQFYTILNGCTNTIYGSIAAAILTFEKHVAIINAKQSRTQTTR